MVRVDSRIKNQIVALYATHSQKVLARKFGLSTWKVMRILREAGARKNKPLTESRRVEVTDAYSRGEGIDVIANRFGVDRSYVTRIAREGGATLRKPRRSSTFYTAYLDSGLNPFWGS